MKGWIVNVTDELARLRAAGMVTFDTAWEYAMAAHPPSGMVLGAQQGRLAFDDDGSVYDFLRRRCEAEWDGQVVDDFRTALGTLIAV